MALEANQTIRWKERIGIMAVSHTFKQVEEFVFDYTLYPAVIALLGAVTGGLVMTVFSALLCYLYIRFYDWSQKDWLGLELVPRRCAMDRQSADAWHGLCSESCGREMSPLFSPSRAIRIRL